MRWDRARAVCLLFVLSSTLVARAQMYPGQSTPAPRSTAPGDLHDAAVQREIHERFSLGIDALSAGNNAAAAAEFQQVLALNPREPQGSTAHYDLSLAYAHLGRLDDAARELRTAIALDGGFLAAMANLIAIDLQRNDLTDARAVAGRFVALAPDSARALYSSGIVALRAGDAKAAANAFGQLLAHNPQYAVAHYDLGLAEMQLGDVTRAQGEFQTALDLSPSYARARFALGTVLLRNGQRAEARAEFDRAAHDAGSDVALQNLANSLRDAIQP
jgi:Flp pilus assembly protein TadD